jgi:putative oligomerization/nucleic acid binding protein/PH (Pleckstrin Homology) domain-containing protein
VTPVCDCRWPPFFQNGPVFATQAAVACLKGSATPIAAFRSPTPPSPPARSLPMNLPDELRKLADLRQQGVLTEDEFAVAKQRLLSSSGSTTIPPTPVAPVEIAPPEPIEEKQYKSSRWSSGNLLFPDALILATDGMLFRKGKMFGSSEEHISYKAVASVRVKNGMFLSNLTVETSGGSQPIFINGLWKSDAREIQDTIRTFQR